MNFTSIKKIAFLCGINLLIFFLILSTDDYFSNLPFVVRDIIGFGNNRIQEKIFLRSYENNFEPTQTLFDVHKVNLRIQVFPESKFIIGRVHFKIRVLKSSDRIVFNLLDNLTVENVFTEGKESIFFHLDNKIEILFEEKLSQREILEIEINYRGEPRDIGLAGFDFVEGTQRFYSLSQPNFAQSWWPCKDDPSDKFLADIEIIVPNKTVGVSNGKLVDIVQFAPNWLSYKYEVSYPISSYSLSVSGADYKEFENSFISISGKNIPLRYFVSESKLNNAKKDFEVIPQMMTAFENLFGEYPFQNEHYGIVEFDWKFGAMEHQTMTSIGSNFITGLKLYDRLLAHELAHEWFGNSVTPFNWKEIWLNEGFATYASYIYLEQTGKKINLNSRQLFYGPVYDPNGFLFGNTVYEKGAWILHMLRRKVGDENFFKSLRKYYEANKYSNSSTTSLKDIFESTCRVDLTKFFNQWIYSSVEKPFYTVSYSTSKRNNDYICTINIEQTQPRLIFENDIEIRLILENKMNLKHILVNNTKKQIVSLIIDSPVMDLVVDPENDLLKEVIYRKFSD
ncbi:MAG: M1 family metallopeptidase [Ignavibacteria bacterium]|nr:M1 family metallopeptidase [Ignavibacteria bacterium]